ncbi:MAG: class I SAM-dependent methyltransferase, partial [Ekhidna sp.]
MKQKFQIDFLKEMGLKPQNTLLDIGCGTLRGGIPIIQFLEEEKYFGIDVREKVIEEAFKELREEKLEHKKPNIEVFSDFKELNYEHSFDIIFAFS